MKEDAEIKSGACHSGSHSCRHYVVYNVQCAFDGDGADLPYLEATVRLGLKPRPKT